MPGPAIYVAVAIGTVAAVIVFKEFVYDPHFRPKISAWREDIISRRQRRARPHSHSVSQSSPPPPEGNDGRQVSPQRDTRGKKKQSRRSVESSVTPHIELQHLIASEVESLKSSVEADGDNTGIRLRRVGESLKPREGNSERISDSNSTQPLISIEGSNVSDEIPSLGLKNRPLKGAAPSPLSIGIHLQQDDASRSGSTPLPPDVPRPLNSHTPIIEMPHATEIFPISGPRDFLTPRAVSGDSENTRPSSPDTDLLSASDIPSVDQSFTTHDQTLSPHRVHGTISPALSSNLSIEFLSSPSFSPPGSPFIDAGIYRELVELHGGGAFERSEISRSLSPNVVEGTPPGATLLAVRGDAEVFSLSSQVSSDMSSDEGDYDYASVLESEGEGVAQH
ncbi:hypothetical protein BJV74DRAFT_880905 [Russula compacta]|nr:hypothetical protein BJV74DRAFT_880905 [Russula compacta]